MESKVDYTASPPRDTDESPNPHHTDGGAPNLYPSVAPTPAPGPTSYPPPEPQQYPPPSQYSPPPQQDPTGQDPHGQPQGDGQQPAECPPQTEYKEEEEETRHPVTASPPLRSRLRLGAARDYTDDTKYTIALSCFVFWCCNLPFGLVAFILAG